MLAALLASDHLVAQSFPTLRHDRCIGILSSLDLSHKELFTFLHLR